MENEAIKLAIENGWNAKLGSVVVMSGAFALEATFWQALGRALGWKKVVDADLFYSPAASEKVMKAGWLYQALRYHELVLTGGDTDKFWKDLLKEETKDN
jgi:hypothetical protein